MKLRLPAAQGGMLLSGMPFSINFGISAQVRGPLTLAQIEHALARLGRRHPLLASRVIAGDDGFAYATNQGVPPIPVKTIPRAGADHWLQEVASEVAIPFDYRVGPPFRLIWLPGESVSDLILICDHLSADGRAGIYALRDLLALLADPALELDPVPAALMADHIPPTIVEKLCAKIAADPQAGRPSGGDWHDDDAQPKQIIPFVLSAAETRALVTRCRAEGVTVQTALCAAFLKPFAEGQSAQPVPRVEIPMDIRDRLTPPVGESYGNFISLVMLALDYSTEQDLWVIARAAKADLAAAIAREDFFYTPTLYITVTGKLPAGMDFATGFDLSISNLGRISIPVRYGVLTLEALYAPIFNVSKSDHRVLGVSTLDGRMHCTYISCEPTAPQFVAHARELLAEMIA